MGKKVTESILTKLAQQIGMKDVLDWYKNDRNSYEQYLGLEKDLTKAREMSKLEAANIIKPPGSFRKPLMIGAGIVGISLIADQIIDWLKEKASEYKSQEYYKKMLEAHPQLQNENPAEVAKYWESLNHFAPQVAKDPLASGAYITQSIRKLSGEQLGGPPPDTFNTLVDIQKKYKEGRPTSSSEKEVGNSVRSEAIRQIISQVYH